jgi:hypothetical protein
VPVTKMGLIVNLAERTVSGFAIVARTRERDSVDPLLAGLIQQDPSVRRRHRSERPSQPNRETPMGRRLAMLLATGALALTAGPTLAHHSFAMFDRNNQIDLEGVVQEFRFVNPHTFIYLAVK